MNSLRPMFLSLLAVGIGLVFSSCASVDTVRLTNQKFPPKESVEGVEILDRTPPCDHVVIARLSVDDSEYDSFESEQKKSLKKPLHWGPMRSFFRNPRKI
ncbi:MAG: hypothetical protein R3351_00450 [Nitrospirales bacterium]|nr:hypothetical protein [Nitrospirales bacterium]